MGTSSIFNGPKDSSSNLLPFDYQPNSDADDASSPDNVPASTSETDTDVPSPELFQENSYSPHSMRHTTACHMLESGVFIMAIKNFLGHSSINTTEIYAQMTQSNIDKAIRDWNDKWFGASESKDQTQKDNIPEFLL